jgi:hypothetical protein
MESTYTAHPMDPPFQVTHSPLSPECPPFHRPDADFFCDDSDDDGDDFYDSQDMPNYGGPAFSTNPRASPHSGSHTDPNRTHTSPIPPTYPDFEDSDDERLAYRSQGPPRETNRARSRSPLLPQPPLTTTPDSDSSGNDHLIFPGSSSSFHQTSARDSRSTSPATPAEKGGHAQVALQLLSRSASRSKKTPSHPAQSGPSNSILNAPRSKLIELDESDPFGFMRHRDGPYQTVNDALKKRALFGNIPSDLDKVDELDESDPFGFMRHRDGPYQTVDDALTKRAPLARNQRKPKVQVSFPSLFTSSSRLTSHSSSAQPQPQTYTPTSTLYTGGVLNLAPGQLFGKASYQPEPPADRVSLPPIDRASIPLIDWVSLPPTSPVSMSTSTPTHQPLHLSKLRKSQHGRLTTREIRVAGESGYYPPPTSQSQHHLFSPFAPPIMASGHSGRSDESDRAWERESRGSRRQTMMDPGVGSYIEAKASRNGFGSSVGSMSTMTSDSASTSRSAISV